MRPFDGIRLIDFSRVISGPYATFLLHLLGADVVKIEQIGGDDQRRGPGIEPLRDDGLSAAFIMFNTGKKSLALDLKSPKAVEIVRKLVRSADVVVENFRPGVMDRLGIGYDALRAVNPKIIYCAISGFGQTGPESGTPAYDGKIQAMSGMMSVTGLEDGVPLRAGYTVADTAAGLNAALAISAAIHQRTRTARSQYIDVSMLDSAMSLMSQSLAPFLNGGVELTRVGNRSISREPTSDVFRTADTDLMLSVNKIHQIEALMREIGREDLIGDDRLKSRDIRERNRDFIRDCVQEGLLRAPAETWERRLNAVGAPCARVLSISQALDHPQVRHNGRVIEMQDDRTASPMYAFNAGFTFEHGAPGTETPPDRCSDHTESLLRDLGLSAEEIDQLSTEGIV